MEHKVNFFNCMVIKLQKLIVDTDNNLSGSFSNYLSCDNKASVSKNLQHWSSFLNMFRLLPVTF